GCVSVFIDGDYGGGIFHSDYVLNRARDADCDVELRRYGLAGASNLSVHRKPRVVADRTRGGDVGFERRRELLDDGDVLLALDAAPDRYDDLRLSEIDRLFGLAEEFERHCSDLIG